MESYKGQIELTRVGQISHDGKWVCIRIDSPYLNEWQGQDGTRHICLNTVAWANREGTDQRGNTHMVKADIAYAKSKDMEQEALSEARKAAPILGNLKPIMGHGTTTAQAAPDGDDDLPC